MNMPRTLAATFRIIRHGVTFRREPRAADRGPRAAYSYAIAVFPILQRI